MIVGLKYGEQAERNNTLKLPEFPLEPNIVLVALVHGRLLSELSLT